MYFHAARLKEYLQSYLYKEILQLKSSKMCNLNASECSEL